MNGLFHISGARRALILAGAGTFLLFLPAIASVISDRYFYEVQHEGEQEFLARMNIALGDVRIGKAEPGYLFQGEVELESERLHPQFDYSSRDGRAELAVDLESEDAGRRSIGIRGLSSARSSQWLMLFSDEVPLDLELKMGLARAHLDFTGLPVRRLALDCGASKTEIAFTESNPIAMESLHIKAGASAFTAHGLGFTRAESMVFDGGAGRGFDCFLGGAPPAPGRGGGGGGPVSL
jgi:hypothetical protein